MSSAEWGPVFYGALFTLLGLAAFIFDKWERRK